MHPGSAEVPQPDGTRLRLARQARGLSQQQLAGVAGVTRQAVSAVESGHSDPSLRVALALARAIVWKRRLKPATAGEISSLTSSDSTSRACTANT